MFIHTNHSQTSFIVYFSNLKNYLKPASFDNNANSSDISSLCFFIHNHIFYCPTGRIDNSEEDSFCYPAGEAWSDYNDVTWVPTVFDPPFASEADRIAAEAVCGDDQACLMDIASTNDLTAGSDAVSISSSFTAEQEVLGKRDIQGYTKHDIVIQHNTNSV